MVQTDYEHITHNGTKLQVDSAIRDGTGRRIDTNYAKKVETYNLQATAENITEITISHSLGDIPSSVQMYILNTATDEYEMFNADVVATDTRIKIRLSSSLPIGTKYYVKALI